jgi:hypothetical protein
MARLIRDWTDSERVHNLSPEAERFFTRLIMKADDFGRYHADLKLLRAYLFPLHTKLKNERVECWLVECEKADLIHRYEVAGKSYLEIKMFDQKLKVRRSKYPPSNEEDRIALIEGYVYLIGTDYTKPVKIGFSVNPWSRLKEITINHPERLDILLTIKAPKQFESALHKSIKGLRVKNEWFKLNPEVVDTLISVSNGEVTKDDAIELFRSNSYELRSCSEVEEEVEVEIEVEPKKKVKKIGFAAPTVDEVKVYFLQNGYSDLAAVKAWGYYDAGNWKDSKGNQVRNWKQKMQSVWFRDEHRIKEHPVSKLENNQW